MASASPWLFKITEDTYLRAFTYAALSTAVATGIVLEYRVTDPFSMYVASGSVPAVAHPSGANLLQTCAVAFMATLLTLVVLHRLFALGESLLVYPKPYSS